MGVDTCLLRVLITLALLSLSFFSKAQSPIASAEPGKAASVESIISEAEAFYDVNFLYSTDFLPEETRQIPDFRHYQLHDALHFIFAGTGIEYTVNGKNILLRKKQLPYPPATPRRAHGSRKKAPLPKPVALAYMPKASFQLPELRPAHFETATLLPVAVPVRPIPAEEQTLPVAPVKLGPVYVLPRKHYDFLDRMGEPVKKLKPNMKVVLADYSNTTSRETDETLYKYRLVNFSVAPGLGSNGLNPGTFYNGLSVNLTVDYSAGNNLMGLAGISNFSKYSAYGLQLAGVVNVVGGDLRQHRNYTRSELLAMRAPFSGIQLAGLGNIVTGDIRGFEGSMVFNVTGGNSQGWQLSGATNMTAEGVTGAQTSALFNFAGLSVSGLQLAAVNYAKGDLHGAQVGMVNRNRSMINPAYATMYGDGLQFGLVNLSGAMGGYQVGLVNRAGSMNGLQIGLVNSSRAARGCHIGLVNIFDEHQGHAFGLLNVGDTYHARFWANETFPANIGIVTGTDDISNIIFYSRNFLYPAQGVWPVQAFGYGLSRGTLFNPRDLTSREFFDYRFHASWVNFSGVKQQPFNILFNPHLVYGRKIQNDLYFSVGGGINAWWMPQSHDYRLSRLEVASLKDAGNVWKFWPGVTFGIEIL